MDFRALLSTNRPADLFANRVTRHGDQNRRGQFVVYWMQSARRLSKNIAFNYAKSFGLPVVTYESRYPAPNERIRAFAGDGDREIPDLANARLIVTDEFPTRIMRAQTKQLIETSPVAVHLVDGNGIFPMRAFGKEQYSAKQLRDRAARLFEQYWSPIADDESPESESPRRVEALQRLRTTTGRNSGLSPYLHFGFLGIHEVVAHVLQSAMSDQDANEFLEQAIIRRELSFNFCFHRDDYDSLSALPDWARRTIDKHRHDRRSPLYTPDQLERAATHDDVWNLAQRQLLACGTMHGYLRMLWGKKLIEWSERPEEALATMIRLFDTHSLDGRDPNTYAGVLWCFGKHDRAWFPERPIFGTLRYMSSDSTRRKVRLAEIERAVTACEASARIPAAS